MNISELNITAIYAEVGFDTVPYLVNFHRPLGLPENKGCRLLVGEEHNSIDINGSSVFPIRIIDSEKVRHALCFTL